LKVLKVPKVLKVLGGVYCKKPVLKKRGPGLSGLLGLSGLSGLSNQTLPKFVAIVDS
jgi:hypothetical protein